MSFRRKLLVIVSAAWLLFVVLLSFGDVEECALLHTCAAAPYQVAHEVLLWGFVPVLGVWGALWLFPIPLTRLANAAVAFIAGPKSRPGTFASLPAVVYQCKKCSAHRASCKVDLSENMSFFFVRYERHFVGHACVRCLCAMFAVFEIRTLLLTWWGIIGMIIGIPYLVSNLFQFVLGLVRLRIASNSGNEVA